MSAFDYKSLKAHVGHKIACVAYGDADDPANVAVECEDCNEVLLDYDKPSPEDEYKCESCGITFESPDHGGCPECHSQNYSVLSTWVCKLCGKEFKAEDPMECPRCNSTDINIREEK